MVIKSKKLKEDICDSLSNRKQNIEKIITLFFGDKIERKLTLKKYNRLYKQINKNLNKMGNDELNSVVKNLDLSNIVFEKQNKL